MTEAQKRALAIATARARLQSQGGAAANAPQTALEQARAAGYETVGISGDGEIMRKPDGQLVFISPGAVTQDQETIAQMMEGATLPEAIKTGEQERIISENPVGSRLAVAVQGVPFIGAYADEAIGAFDPQKGANVRSAAEAVRAQRPGQATALEVGGALAAVPALMAATPAAVAGFAGRGATLGSQMLRGAGLGAAAGATEGAVSGYGRGEGEGRQQSAVEGGVIGGALGGAVGAVAPAVSSGIRAAWQNIKGRTPTQIAKALNISPDAARVVRTALENDDLDAAQAALQRAGSTSMLADAGPGTRNLLDTSVVSGGTAPRVAGEAVTQRAQQAGQRMNTVLDDVLGAPEGTQAMQRNIRQGSQGARSSAYDAAYASPIDYSAPRGRTLEGLLGRVPRSAINQANELMRLEGVTSGQILADIAEDGTVSYRRLPDVRQLDYMARALGDVSEQQSAAGKLGGTTQLGRATGNLQRDIRSVLRQEVPAYGEALDTAADSISRIRAVETGADVLKPSTTREQVAEAMRGTSAAERNAARAGLRSAIDENLARVNAVASDPNTDIREFQRLANNLRSRSARDKMEVVLGPRDAARLYDELDEAVVSLELRGAISRNSATAGRQAIQGSVRDQTAPGAVGLLLEGEPINATKRIVQTITGTTPEARTLRQMGIYDEIAQTLTGLRGQQAQDALGLVRRAMDGEALNETQARVIAKALTAPAAAATYSAGRAEVEN